MHHKEDSDVTESYWGNGGRALSPLVLQPDIIRIMSHAASEDDEAPQDPMVDVGAPVAKRKKASLDLIATAYNTIMEENLSFRKTSGRFGVSVKALLMRKKAGVAVLTRGRPCILTDDDLDALKNVISERTSDGKMPSLAGVKELAVNLAVELDPSSRLR
jgi:hypothetical protein